MNLLRSLYFLQTTARADFYFKVIVTSVTNGLVVWGSCSKSFFDELEKLHVCAAKIIYGLDWYTPSDQVLAQSRCSTVKGLYKYRLLMLAHDSFYNFLPVPIMKLFTKYECDYNLTFLLPSKTKHWSFRKFTCNEAVSLWNSLDNHTCAISSNSLFKNAELHVNSIILFQIGF